MKKFLLSLLIVFSILLVPFTVRANPLPFPGYIFTLEDENTEITVNTANLYLIDIWLSTGKGDFISQDLSVESVDDNSVVLKPVYTGEGVLPDGQQITVDSSHPLYLGDPDYSSQEVKISYLSTDGDNAKLLLERSRKQGDPNQLDEASRYCINRGGDIQNENCVFPDGAICAMWDFYNGTCAKDKSLCVEKGYDKEFKVMTMPGTDNVKTEVIYCIDDQGRECIEYDLEKGNCGKDTSMSATFGLNYIDFGKSSNDDSDNNNDDSDSDTQTDDNNDIDRLVSTGVDTAIVFFATIAAIIVLIYYFTSRKKKGAK